MLSPSDQAAFLKSFGVPALIDAAVNALLADPPHSTKQLLTALHQVIDEKAGILQAESSRCFVQAIKELNEGTGFSASTPLFFCALDSNGELVELFPFGSRIRVTPFNVDHYTHCVESARRGESVVPWLPLASTQSLGGSYAPVLELMAQINSGDVHLQISEGDWERFGVTYCVPNNGVAVELMPNGARTPVKLADLPSYVAQAKQKLAELQRAGRRRSLNSGSAPDNRLPLAPSTPQPPPAQQKQQAVQPMQASPRGWAPSQLAARPSVNDEQPTLSTGDGATSSNRASPSQFASLVDGGGSASNRPSYEILPLILDELGRANTLDGSPLSKEDFEMLDVYYCVPVAGKIVPLIPNGKNIRVRFEDKDHFVRLAKEKLGLPVEPAKELSRRFDLRSTAKGVHQGPGDGLLSPGKYEFDLFNKTGVSPTHQGGRTPGGGQFGGVQPESPIGQRALSAGEIDYHFRTLLRQLSATTWTSAEMENLNLFFVAPQEGKFVELIQNGARIPVTAERKDEFVLLARKFLGETAPPNRTIQPEVTAVLPKKDDENVVESMFSPTHFQQDLFAPYTTTLDLEAGAAAKPEEAASQEPANSAAAEEEEGRFWDMIQLLESGHGPTNVEELNLRFVLKFPNDRLLPLKDNGAAKKVTNENLHEFIELVRGKKDLIHLAFVFSHKKAEEDDRNISRYSPSDARTWNKYELGADDVDNPIFKLVEGLRHWATDSTGLTSADFERMGLTFCIPLANGKRFDLIPNGHNTRVTLHNRQEYISRVEYERRQLMKRVRRQTSSDEQSRTATSSSSSPSAVTNPAGAAGRGAGSARFGGSGTGSASRNSISVSSQQQAMGSSLTKRGSMRMHTSITTAPLTQPQIDHLRQFREYLLLFRDTHFTEAEWNEMQVVFNLKAPNMSIDLVPNGSKTRVSMDRKDEYVDRALAKIDEMLDDVKRREDAVKDLPQQGGEPQVALFSPSHFERDFFAPAQDIITAK